ncbi:hypothetical protein D3C81_1539460 [compost metagenome]
MGLLNFTVCDTEALKSASPVRMDLSSAARRHLPVSGVSVATCGAAVLLCKAVKLSLSMATRPASPWPRDAAWSNCFM